MEKTAVSLLRKCNSCQKDREVSEFCKAKTKKDGLSSRCRVCEREYNRQYYIKHRELMIRKARQYALDNWETVQLRRKKYRLVNYERLCLQAREYQRVSHGTRSDYHREYSAKNRAALTEYKREYHASRKRRDTCYKLACYLRSRLFNVLKGRTKEGSSVRDLGCSVADLKKHLESLFQPGMTWENWGIGEGKWNIDHIMPLSAFNLTDRQHFLLANHYCNLQPLWSEDNLRKWNKLPEDKCPKT